MVKPLDRHVVCTYCTRPADGKYQSADGKKWTAMCHVCGEPTEYDRLRHVNAVLLKALKALLAEADASWLPDRHKRVRDEARAAIAHGENR